RVCDVTGMGEVVDIIHHYDTQNRELAFWSKNPKTPFFIKRIDNRWCVEPRSPNYAEVCIEVEITLMPVFKQLFGGILRRLLSKRTDSLLSELKYFAEHDRARISVWNRLPETSYTTSAHRSSKFSTNSVVIKDTLNNLQQG
ncbi:MAG: hypothetical protein AAF639_45355, partial [Chloroflexota bacterium]